MRIPGVPPTLPTPIVARQAQRLLGLIAAPVGGTLDRKFEGKMSSPSFARAVPGLAAPVAAHFFAIRLLKRNPEGKGGIANRRIFQ